MHELGKLMLTLLFLSLSLSLTHYYYRLNQEIAQMEAQVYELKQKVQYTQEVKTVLDSWVRHEASVREKEQKELVSHVIDKVKASLNNPKMVRIVVLYESVVCVI